jgi:phospholipid/cholesterol/gamma-HCH transport system substrate-binding protein
MKMHYSHKLLPRRISQIAGLFILIPLVGLVILGLFMAKSEQVFEKKYRLHSRLSQSYGLEPGAPVMISGVPIGRVESVEFTDTGTIDVTLQLRQRYKKLVRGDSAISIEKSGVLVGQTQVAVQIGTTGTPALEDGAMIKAVEPQDFKAMLAEFKPALESVKAALLRLDDLTKDIQGTVQTGTRTLAHVEETTKELPAVVASVQRTVASVERTAGNVERTAAGLPEITGMVRKTLGRVDLAVADMRGATEKLPAIVGDAQAAVNNIKSTTENLKGVSRQATPLLRTAHATLDDVHTIIRGAKRTFPVSMFVANAGPGVPEQTETGLVSLRGKQPAR